MSEPTTDPPAHPHRGDHVVLKDGRVGVVVTVGDQEGRPGTLLIRLADDGEIFTATLDDLGMDTGGPSR